MGDRTLRWLIVGLLLAATPLSSCHRMRQDEWDVQRPTSARSARSAPLAERGSPVDPVARGLFAKNCATCHGLDGSGQGPSVLDRPARNFKDGGFSFGNTADAIFNTISSGIPGTPMPAFADALAESDRRRLAAYVRTLGPAVEEVDVAETILTVTEESGPRIVRGILPPIVKGAPVRPRGLLVGLPGGLTFEYRVDDVRLLGVRQGGFVERTDWRDRGGTPLKPLGGLIWVDEGGDPPATFTMDRGPDLRRSLSGTTQATLRSTLITSDGARVAQVEETVAPIRRGDLTGFSRRMVISRFSPNFESMMLRVRIPAPDQATLVESLFGTDGDDSQRESSWRASRRADGLYECTGVVLSGHGVTSTVDDSGARLEVQLRMPENSPPFWRTCEVTVLTVFCTEWSTGTREALRGTGR